MQTPGGRRAVLFSAHPSTLFHPSPSQHHPSLVFCGILPLQSVLHLTDRAIFQKHKYTTKAYVTTHLLNQLALKRNGAGVSGPSLAIKKENKQIQPCHPLLKTNPMASSFFQDKKSKNPSHDPSDVASNPSVNQLALPSKTIQKTTTSYHLQFNHLATTIFSPLGFCRSPFMSFCIQPPNPIQPHPLV